MMLHEHAQIKRAQPCRRKLLVQWVLGHAHAVHLDGIDEGCRQLLVLESDDNRMASRWGRGRFQGCENLLGHQVREDLGDLLSEERRVLHTPIECT